MGSTVVEELQVLIKQHGAKEVASAMKGVEKQTDKTTSSLLKLAAGYVSIRAAWSGAKGLAKLFGEQEMAENRLEARTRRLGDVTGQFSDRLKEEAAAMQRVSMFGDEVWMSTQRLLLDLGANSDNITKATKATGELAAALDMDLNSAARLVGQALSGNVQTLARYIPAVRDLTKEEIEQGKAIDLVLEKLGGSMRAQEGTLNFAFQQLSMATGDLGEKVFAPMAPIVRDLASAFSEVAAEIQKVGEKEEFLAILADIIPGMQVVSAGARERAAQLRMIAEQRSKAREELAIIEGYMNDNGLGEYSKPKGSIAAEIAAEIEKAKIEARAQRTAAAGKGTGYKVTEDMWLLSEVELANLIEDVREQNRLIALAVSGAGDLGGDEARQLIGPGDEIYDNIMSHEKNVADTKIKMAENVANEQKRLAIEAAKFSAEEWERRYGAMTRAGADMAGSFAVFFSDMTNYSGKAADKILLNMLGMLGDIAISHGVVAMKTAFAEAYQSGGLSLVQLAPAALLIAAGTALKAGQVLTASGASSSAGGGGYGRSFAAQRFNPQSSSTNVTINVTGFVGNDLAGLEQSITRAVKNGQRERG